MVSAVSPMNATSAITGPATSTAAKTSANRHPKPPTPRRRLRGRPLTGIWPGMENDAGRCCCGRGGGAIGTS